MKINLDANGLTFGKRPIVGDTRIITFPAIFPVTVGDEQRWLEIVKIQQVCVKTHENNLDPFYSIWEDYRFIDYIPFWLKFWLKIKNYVWKLN